MENLNSDYRTRLVEKNVEYYIERFDRMEETGRRNTWNWFAFLVPFCWFAYRKLYLECVAYYLITNGLNTVITQILMNHGATVNVGWTIDIVAMFMCGIYGNWLYKAKIDRQVEHCLELPEDKRESYIKRRSGTSVIAIIVAFCITIAFAAVLYKFNVSVV